MIDILKNFTKNKTIFKMYKIYESEMILYLGGVKTSPGKRYVFKKNIEQEFEFLLIFL